MLDKDDGASLVDIPMHMTRQQEVDKRIRAIEISGKLYLTSFVKTANQYKFGIKTIRRRLVGLIESYEKLYCFLR